LTDGQANTNYAVVGSRGETVLLKICNEKTREQLWPQMRALTRLRTCGYRTAYPWDRLHGKASPPGEREEDRFIYAHSLGFVILYDFLDGRAGAHERTSPQMMRQLGRAVAELHSVDPVDDLPSFPMGITSMRPFLESVDATHPNVASHPFLIWLRCQLSELMPRLESAGSLPLAMLHGDCFIDNVMFREDDSLVGVIDFEEVCSGPAILDLAMTVCGCCYTPQNEMDPHLFDAFLSAYEKERPLLPAERAVLWNYLRYTCLAIAFWRFRQFVVRHPEQSSEAKKQSYKPMQARVEDMSSAQTLCEKHRMSTA